MAKRRRRAARKGKYKVRNWSQYSDSLVQRGSLTVWIQEDIVNAWQYSGPKKPGANPFYSDLTIECLLTLRSVYHLPLRATEGLARSLFELMSLSLPVPNYSTLCRRAASLQIDLGSRKEPISHLVLDSTGLKIYGEGEWKARQHGTTKRRTWRKLHLAVNSQTHEVEAVALTTAGTHDSQAVEPLLDQVKSPVERLSGDGTYDKRVMYKVAAHRGIEPIIPPSRNAKIWKHGNSKGPAHPRDQAVRRIREVGRRAWKQESGYHRRSLAETAVYRCKTIFGGHLASRLIAQQVTEARVRARALNRMTHLGMPETVQVA